MRYCYYWFLSFSYTSAKSNFILLNYYKFKRLSFVYMKDTLLMPMPGLFERERSIYYLTSSMGARVLVIMLRLAMSGLGDLMGSFIIFLDLADLIVKWLKNRFIIKFYLFDFLWLDKIFYRHYRNFILFSYLFAVYLGSESALVYYGFC